MAVLSHFTLNSDYTAIKEAQNFSLTLNVTKKSVRPYDYYNSYIDIYVPAGAFIENVTIYWSYTGDTVPSSELIVDEMYSYGMMQTEIFLYRVNATTYRLRHYVINTDENSHNAGGYTITAKAHLFTTSG
jgi:hypothetical protein